MYFNMSKLRLPNTIVFQQRLPKLRRQVHYNIIALFICHKNNGRKEPRPSTVLFISSERWRKWGTTFWRNKKGIYKRTCMSNHENHGLQIFCVSLHFNNFKRIITFGPETYHLRTTVAIGLTHASTVFNSFSSSFGTFLVRNVKYKIMFTLVLFCELYTKQVGNQNLQSGDQIFPISCQLDPEQKS